MTDTNRQEPTVLSPMSRTATATGGGVGTQTMLLGTELVNADVVVHRGLVATDTERMEAPGGVAVTWLLLVDGARVACTDEPLTDQGAQEWARRLLGEHTRFHPVGRGGGHWLAEGGTIFGAGEGGWVS